MKLKHPVLNSILYAASATLLGTYPAFAAFTVFDAPGSSSGTTYAYGIDSGNVVGTFEDNDGISHGYITNATAYAELNEPLANHNYGGTHVQGIDSTNMVGYYYDASFHCKSFLYNGTSWTSFSSPDGPNTTIARGISGTNIVGSFKEDPFTYTETGFIYNGTTFKNLMHASASADFGTRLSGIDGNLAVGNYWNASGLAQGFLYDMLANGGAGDFTKTIQYPGASATSPMGIDGTTVVGSYTMAGINHGFSYDINSNAYVSYDAPGATMTYLTDVDGTDFTGYLYNATGWHGFSTVGMSTSDTSAVPEPGSLVATAGLLASGLMIRRRKRSI